jgi:hypothetical protein
MKGFAAFLVASGLGLATASGQLAAGDVAIVAYNTTGSKGSDQYAWVALRTIPSNTVLNFTDSSVSGGYFRWTEHLGTAPYHGPLAWSNTSDLAAGAVGREMSSICRYPVISCSSTRAALLSIAAFRLLGRAIPSAPQWSSE